MQVEVKIENDNRTRHSKWKVATIKRISHAKQYFKVELGPEDGETIEKYSFSEEGTRWRTVAIAKKETEIQTPVQRSGTARKRQVPSVGAVVEILFSDNKWYRGMVVSEEPGGLWRVCFEDGDEDTFQWPDPEVRIIGKSRKSRSVGNDQELSMQVTEIRVGTLVKVNVAEVAR